VGSLKENKAFHYNSPVLSIFWAGHMASKLLNARIGEVFDFIWKILFLKIQILLK